MLTTQVETEFKPFLVENPQAKTVFRIMELGGGIRRGQIEQLLERFPLHLDLRTQAALACDAVNEPIEVYVEGNIIAIYPPRHRVITAVALAYKHDPVATSKLHVDNLVDLIVPGRGQLRSCIHFDPAIFGIHDWRNMSACEEIEVDIHVHPKGTENEPQLKPPGFGKRDVLKLLKLIAGDNSSLTVGQFREWKDLILYAVNSMRYSYENPDVDPNYPVRLYYKDDWQSLDAAKGNDEKTVAALNTLMVGIEME